MFASKDTLLTRPSGYNIARSVRLRSSASAYFNRTFGTPTSATIWTWSAWVKRGALTGTYRLFGASTTTFLTFNSSDQLNLTLNGVSAATSTAVFRDPSAWYHIVYQQNGSAQTIYVNSVSIATGTTAASIFNTAISHQIGAANTTNYFDGYLTEINFIDGQALTPSSFGETDSITGVWKAKKYGGTYGTNGFYLNFSDNSNNTATTIGKDYSGNGNNWTPNNISVTAGSTYDSMTDVPTLTSATAANYAVWNPLKATAGTYSSANLGVVRSGAANVDLPVSTLQIPKTVPIYCEISFGNQDSSYGIAKDTSNSGANGIVGSSSDGASYGAYVTTDSTYYGFWNNNSRTSFNFSGGTIYQMAFDQANGKLWFGKDNTWYNSGNPTNGTNPTFSSISTTTDFFVAALATTSAASVNFGQRPFTYTPPTGYVALNTFNLPASTITNGAAYMAATTYTGTFATNVINNAVNGVSMQPDFVWLKARSDINNNALFDSVRGVNKRLISNLTNAEDTFTDTLMSFNSNGYTLGADAGGRVNNTGVTYVGWQWKAGGTSSSNTNGSITSTVSAGATQGFSVVTYTGNGSSSATVGHGLGVTPSMIIVKARSGGSDWETFHTSLGASYGIRLNTTAAKVAASSTAGGIISTSPTSTTFGFTAGTSNVNNANENGVTFVAYCFSAVAGYSAFGSYTGNGSTDGTFVFTNFQPRWVMIKRTDSTSDWYIWDTSRDTYNVMSATLLADTSGAETSATSIDGLSNGFKCRSATVVNVSTATYIYAAFASSPFKNSLAR